MRMNIPKDKKIAVVTGACRGIGAAIAKQLINDKYYVIGIHKGNHQHTPLSQKLMSNETLPMVLESIDLSQPKKLNVLLELFRDTLLIPSLIMQECFFLNHLIKP